MAAEGTLCAWTIAWARRPAFPYWPAILRKDAAPEGSNTATDVHLLGSEPKVLSLPRASLQPWECAHKAAYLADGGRTKRLGEAFRVAVSQAEQLLVCELAAREAKLTELLRGAAAAAAAAAAAKLALEAAALPSAIAAGEEVEEEQEASKTRPRAAGKRPRGTESDAAPTSERASRRRAAASSATGDAAVESRRASKRRDSAGTAAAPRVRARSAGASRPAMAGGISEEHAALMHAVGWGFTPGFPRYPAIVVHLDSVKDRDTVNEYLRHEAPNKILAMYFDPSRTYTIMTAPAWHGWRGKQHDKYVTQARDKGAEALDEAMALAEAEAAKPVSERIGRVAVESEDEDDSGDDDESDADVVDGGADEPHASTERKRARVAEATEVAATENASAPEVAASQRDGESNAAGMPPAAPAAGDADESSDSDFGVRARQERIQKRASSSKGKLRRKIEEEPAPPPAPEAAPPPVEAMAPPEPAAPIPQPLSKAEIELRAARAAHATLSQAIESGSAPAVLIALEQCSQLRVTVELLRAVDLVKVLRSLREPHPAVTAAVAEGAKTLFATWKNACLAQVKPTAAAAAPPSMTPDTLARRPPPASVSTDASTQPDQMGTGHSQASTAAAPSKTATVPIVTTSGAPRSDKRAPPRMSMGVFLQDLDQPAAAATKEDRTPKASSPGAVAKSGAPVFDSALQARIKHAVERQDEQWVRFLSDALRGCMDSSVKKAVHGLSPAVADRVETAVAAACRVVAAVIVDAVRQVDADARTHAEALRFCAAMLDNDSTRPADGVAVASVVLPAAPPPRPWPVQPAAWFTRLRTVLQALPATARLAAEHSTTDAADLVNVVLAPTSGEVRVLLELLRI